MKRRIVSLVPSLSETIVEFGLRGEIVGVTKFCIAPSDLHRSATLIGGTKDPDIEKIRELQPTHILTNEEENKPEHIAACRTIAPTLLTFPKAPRDVPGMLEEMIAFLGLSDAEGITAHKISSDVQVALKHLMIINGKSTPATKKRYAYLIWREPFMLAGRDTYISQTLESIGYENVYTGEERYPNISLEELSRLAPDELLFSTEPYPFRMRDRDFMAKEWPRKTPLPAMRKVDGQAFSWYGSRTLEMLHGLISWRESGTGGPFLSWTTDKTTDSQIS